MTQHVHPYLTAPPRPLPIALAHSMQEAPLRDQSRHALLNRLFDHLDVIGQFHCRAELVRVARKQD